MADLLNNPFVPVLVGVGIGLCISYFMKRKKKPVQMKKGEKRRARKGKS